MVLGTQPVYIKTVIVHELVSRAKGLVELANRCTNNGSLIVGTVIITAINRWENDFNEDIDAAIVILSDEVRKSVKDKKEPM